MTLLSEDKRKYDNSNRITDNTITTVFRHNSVHTSAIKHMMEEYDCKKSEAIRMIIEEWLYYVAGK